ncbi:MAG: hypothetical protein V4721_02090, partial [Bacteroidota bacterium]
CKPLFLSQVLKVGRNICHFKNKFGITNIVSKFMLIKLAINFKTHNLILNIYADPDHTLSKDEKVRLFSNRS